MKQKTMPPGIRLKAAAAALALALTLLPTSTSRAAGLLVADGGFGGVLEIEQHDVQVTVNSGIAVTQVTQVFRNTETRQVEALYSFPVPKGASVANFSMWINGKEMVGEVMEKQRAREIYESYKQTRRDPGLLEQVDYKTFEMRIFPIGPEAEQRVQITYYQELDVDRDWATYVYPLATSTRKDIDTRTRGRFALSFEVKSAIPVAELESPSHPADFAIASHSPHYFQASLETTGGSLADDVVVAYRMDRPQTGLDLVTSRQAGEDGFFCLTLTAGDDLASINEGMDYVLVLDISGSMATDGKLLLSKDSLGAFAAALDEKDRLELIAFNVQANLAFGELRPATAETHQAAQNFLASQSARGGTVLGSALSAAYRYADPDRPLNVVVLSDGLTQQKERRVLMRQIQSRPGNTRVFCIGVGNDVNRPLLEQLADDSGGLASFLSRGDNLQRQASAFRRKLLRPAATALQIDIKGVDVYALEPTKLPDLFHGSPVKLYGRYRGNGSAEVNVRASVRGQELKESATLPFPKTDSNNPEIDRMWAWRKIDGLLKSADRVGTRDKVRDEIIELGESFSIVTEYTSFLVLENDAEYRRWKIARNNVERTGRDRRAQQQLRAGLDAIRDRAVAGLGPQSDRNEQDTQLMAKANRATNRGNPTPDQTTASPARPQSKNMNFGTGPVGPLLISLMLALRWMVKRRS